MNQNIGEKIRIKRQIKGIKQFDMANKLAISESAYGKIERGESSLTIDRLKEIADYLETSIAELIDSTIYYDLRNGNNSPVALHNSNVQINDQEQTKSIQKLVELGLLLIEKQNQLMTIMITMMDKK